MRKVLLLCLSCFVTASYAQAQDTAKYDIRPYMVASYSDRFTRPVAMTVNLDYRLNNGQTSLVSLSDYQFTAKPYRYQNKNWLAVEHQGVTSFGNRQIRSNATKLHDPESLRLIYDLDTTNNETTYYEWLDFPYMMALNESIDVGQATKKNESGKVLSQTKIQYLLTTNSRQYEFCEVGLVTDLIKNITYTKKSCDMFDRNGVLRGTRFEQQDPNGVVYIRGSGSIEVKSKSSR